MNADRLLSSKVVGSVAATVARPAPSSWIIATDGSATMATELVPATAGWGFVVQRAGVLEGIECECWGEVLLDERDPRVLGADSLSNNAGELWALAEALLWLKNESGDSGRVPVILVYDSEVARGLVTEPWAPHSHLQLVALLRDLYWAMVDQRSITWIHVRSHGRERDPSKQQFLPLNEQADRLAERGRSGTPCFVLKRWVYIIGDDEPELAVERCRFCRRIFSTARAANIHETRCRLRGEVRAALSCRKCGVLFARHFGRAVRRNHEQYCLGSSVANLTCRTCGELFVHMQARRLHERFCGDIRPDVEGTLFWSCTCGFEVRLPQRASRRDKATATHKKYVHHKNCKGGVAAQLTCSRCLRVFGSVRARAAHESSCKSCRWCDLMFRSVANRAQHETHCPARPMAEAVAD